MFLIKEHTDNIEMLIENTSSGKKYFIEGNFLAYDVSNKNGRIYEERVMRSAVNKYIESYVKSNRSVGELGHPPTPSINLDRVSHIIKSLTFNEGAKTVVGKAQIIDTPCGDIAKKLMEAGVQLGVSSRGLGSIKNISGKNYVQEDFTLNTVDIVSDPSGPGCFVQGIMENAEWLQNSSGDWMQIVVDVHKERIDEAVAIKEFTKLMKQLVG